MAPVGEIWKVGQMPIRRKSNNISPIAAALALIFTAGTATAQTRAAPPPPAVERMGLDSVFGANMVLQRDHPVRLWGRGKPGERVALSLGTAHAEVTAGVDGRWAGVLPARPAGGPLVLRASAPSFDDYYPNVLVGDVWLCSGQSNMEFRRSKANDLDLDFATDDGLRLLDIGRRQDAAPSPHLMTLGGWSISATANAANFSAICHRFGQRLRAALDVPIGLISASWGGTRIAAFIDAPTLDARGLSTDDPDPASRQNSGRLFNAMIAPLGAVTLRGVLWYQGESDTHRPAGYRSKLAALAASWRKAFSQPLPFVVVQLPTFDPTPLDPSGNWAAVREAQRRFVADDGNAGLVVQIDQGSATELHPPEKALVAERSAAVALAVIYRRKAIKIGPILSRARRTGNVIALRFEVAERLIARKGDAVEGFEVCGESCVKAASRIVGRNRVQRMSARSHASDDSASAS